MINLIKVNAKLKKLLHYIYPTMALNLINMLTERERRISNANWYTMLYGVVIHQPTCDGTSNSDLFLILASTSILLQFYHHTYYIIL